MTAAHLHLLGAGLSSRRLGGLKARRKVSLLVILSPVPPSGLPWDIQSKGGGVIRSVPALAPTPAGICSYKGEFSEEYQGEINPYLLRKETEREKLKSEFRSSLFF